MNSLKKVFGAVALTVSLAACTVASASAQQLTGAGSTFVNPIMTRWIADFSKANGLQVNYQAIGSGGGISALISRTVNFAGSDVPMNPNELAQAKSPVFHIPDVVGAVVVAYNLPGIGGGVRLTGPVLADIYLGKITMWNDKRIADLNPGTNFPNESIFVAHRSDGSGTTAIYTDYLCKISTAWKSGPGAGKSIDWPQGLGGKGNAGVAGLLKTHKYSLGYIELAYAVQNNISYALVQNAKGKFIYPSIDSAAAAAQSVKVSSNLTASLTNSPSPDGYPITGYSYLIVYQRPDNAADLKKFLSFVVSTGQGDNFTKPGFYAPVPTSVRAAAVKEINAL